MNNPLSSDVTSKPNVNNSGLDEFRLRRPPLFPSFPELVNREVLPPSGLKSLETMAADMAPAESDSLSLTRAATMMESSDESVAEKLISGSRVENSTEAAEVAAITRDQIRWEPRVAVMAQANSSPTDVLAVLQ